MNRPPKVSVVMPAYNSESYIAEAIESILKQTFIDFEFIIVDDGSRDNTCRIVESFKKEDSRIIFIKKKENSGNYPARNLGMKRARGKYICVMDSDDIAMPDRIEKQFQFMETNKKYGLCGGQSTTTGEEDIRPWCEYEKLKIWQMGMMSFRHPTVFIRRSFLKKYHLSYNTNLRYAADYDFLVRAAELFPIANIPNILLQYRRHNSQISTANSKEQTEFANSIRINQLKNFNMDYFPEEIILHKNLMNRRKPNDKNEFKRMVVWANRLVKQNLITGFYHSEYLALFLRSLLKNIQLPAKTLTELQ
jgi:glycosyltransferase involved in cell wall biosynthesis